jgi:hypothetical protein
LERGGGKPTPMLTGNNRKMPMNAKPSQIGDEMSGTTDNSSSEENN